MKAGRALPSSQGSCPARTCRRPRRFSNQRQSPIAYSALMSRSLVEQHWGRSKGAIGAILRGETLRLMLEILKRIWAALVGFFRPDSTQVDRQFRVHHQVYKLRTFEDRSLATTEVKHPGVVAIVGHGSKHKWLLMTCPCGCGETLALNLMRSHTPRWRVEARSEALFSVFPSIDALSCGAHFWIRDGKVIWCD